MNFSIFFPISVLLVVFFRDLRNHGNFCRIDEQMAVSLRSVGLEVCGARLLSLIIICFDIELALYYRKHEMTQNQAVHIFLIGLAVVGLLTSEFLWRKKLGNGIPGKGPTDRSLYRVASAWHLKDGLHRLSFVANGLLARLLLFVFAGL